MFIIFQMCWFNCSCNLCMNYILLCYPPRSHQCYPPWQMSGCKLGSNCFSYSLRYTGETVWICNNKRGPGIYYYYSSSTRQHPLAQSDSRGSCLVIVRSLLHLLINMKSTIWNMCLTFTVKTENYTVMVSNIYWKHSTHKFNCNTA